MWSREWVNMRQVGFAATKKSIDCDISHRALTQTNWMHKLMENCKDVPKPRLDLAQLLSKHLERNILQKSRISSDSDEWLEHVSVVIWQLEYNDFHYITPNTIHHIHGAFNKNLFHFFSALKNYWDSKSKNRTRDVQESVAETMFLAASDQFFYLREILYIRPYFRQAWKKHLRC